MCGGLVVLAPGSPYQILGAILIMQFHLLVVLKLAPFIKDSEDWSSFISTLGLCAMSLGAYSMMLHAGKEELDRIGAVLVGISVFCITIVIAIMILIDCGLWKRLHGAKTNVTEELQTQIQPVNENTILNIDEDNQNNQNNQSINEVSNSSGISTVPIRNIGSGTQIHPAAQNQNLRRDSLLLHVHNIHEEHRQSQITLDANIQRQARKQKRKTELRVQARSKLKQQKILTNVPAFAKLTENEIEAMINVMTRENHLKGTVLCLQGDVANKFYVVMDGECIACIKRNDETRKVGTIGQFKFFGESSLLSEQGVDLIRNASVEVSTEVLTVMVLTKSNFHALIESGKLNKDVLEGVKKIDLERQAENVENDDE